MQLSQTLSEGVVSAHRIVMVGIYLGAIVGGWYMLPGDSERVAMLERDGHFRDALTILENRHQNGDKSYSTLSRLQTLYDNDGNVRKSGEVLSEMAAQRPRDASVQQRLVEFYRTNQNEAGYVDALKSQLTAKYSEAACRDLSARLRLMGNYTRELEALQACRQAGFRRPDDMLRLASLLASTGDTVQATALLRSIDDVKRLKTQAQRFQLLELLLDQGQPKDAERRALRWVRAQKDDTAFAVGVVDLFARSRYPESAVELAKDAGTPGDSISLTVAERLLEKSQVMPAKLYLRGWLASASFDDRDTAIRFTDAALAASDPETAYGGARRFGLEVLPSAQLLRLAAALDGVGMVGDAEEVRLAAQRVELSPAKVPNTGADDRYKRPATSPNGSESSATPPPTVTQPRRLLVDNLDKWRKALASRMSDDAEKRIRSLQFGPSAPVGARTGHHHQGRSHVHDGRQDLQGGGRLLNKTAQVLQRAKKNKLLKAQRKQARDKAKAAAITPNPAQQGGQPPQPLQKAPKSAPEKPETKAAKPPWVAP